MSRAKITASLATMAFLALAALAPASAFAEFGFTEINSTGTPAAPAFPGEKAVWAGTCDLANASTANGGTGTAPAVRPHCLDIGGPLPVFYRPSSSDFWGSSPHPSWRLEPVTQAAAHPDATAAFFFNVKEEGKLDGNVRDVIVRLPPGVVGSPTALPRCSAVAAQYIPPECPADTQAGLTTLDLQTLGVNEEIHPVYNVEARSTITAEFSIANVAGLFNIPVTARGRTNGDYGVDTLALLIPTYGTLYGQAFTFWGVPWAADHDPFRVDGESLGEIRRIPVTGVEPEFQRPYEPSWGPIRPFFTNPSRCQPSPLTVGFDVDSWENPGARLPDETPDTSDPNWKIGDVEQELLTGCEKLNFEPSITLHPTVDVADSPSGLDVTLKTPQNESLPDEPQYEVPPPDASKGEVEHYVAEATAYWKSTAGLASPDLRNTVVHLPTGTSFNPAAANGLNGCTASEVGLTQIEPQVLFNNDKVTCPESSTIGTLQIDSPLLPKPLFGKIYAATQKGNPFPGTLTALYLVAQDEERGLSIKLAGKVDLDPSTGQISTSFVDNPQLPFDDFLLHFRSGPRAPLNNPPVCGHFENAAELIPWSFPQSGPQPTIHDPFAISQMPNGLRCAERPQDRAFRPGFEAGTTSTQAGSFTNFVLNVTRADGEQEVSGISLDMPPGVTASLKGIPYCTQAEIEAAARKTGLEETNQPSCPQASYVGKVNTLAGAGPDPLPTAGRIYLSGPYDPDGAGPEPAAPLSVVTIVPAIAGGTPGNPTFDLGNIVIHTGVQVDPETAQVHIDTTRIPYIVGGVPLRLRRISVELDRPGFMLNPTNCEALQAGGQIDGAANPLDPSDDIAVPVANRFQVGGCQGLAFKPRLKLALKGGVRRTKFPALTATLTQPPGQANIGRVAVTLPFSEYLAQEHINTVCTRVQFNAGAGNGSSCPRGSIYGHAEAETPLLSDKLTGNVYLRSSSHRLPDLVAALRGPASQPIAVDLDGRIDSVQRKGTEKAGIRNSFEVVPDVPVSRFVLKMRGGKRGLLVNSQNICTKTKVTHRAGKKVRRKVRARNAAHVVLTSQSGKVLRLKPVVRATSCHTKRARRHHRRGRR